MKVGLLSETSSFVDPIQPKLLAPTNTALTMYASTLTSYSLFVSIIGEEINLRAGVYFLALDARLYPHVSRLSGRSVGQAGGSVVSGMQRSQRGCVVTINSQGTCYKATLGNCKASYVYILKIAHAREREGEIEAIERTQDFCAHTSNSAQPKEKSGKISVRWHTPYFCIDCISRAHEESSSMSPTYTKC